MEKVIYSKFSNERKAEYMIVTKIIEKTDGSRRVLKSAINAEGAPHIKGLTDSRKVLSEYYKDNKLLLAPCKMIDDVTAEFEYVDGVRYDEYIRELFLEFKWEQLKTELTNFKRIISNVNSITEFKTCDEFENVFGKCDYTEILNKKAFSISNIDMIFGNLIIKDDILHVTDYEWVYNFPVPINYVVYRSLMLSNDFSMLNDDKKNELYYALEISTAEIAVYNAMEKNFQRYVSGKNIFEEYRKNSNNKTKVLDLSGNVINNGKINVYAITEDERKEKIDTRDVYENEIVISEHFLSGYKKMLFEYKCSGMIVKIRNVFVNDDVNTRNVIELKTNADLIIGNDYYFKDKDVMIEITNSSYTNITMELFIYYQDTSLIANYTDKIIDCDKANKTISELERRLILKDGDISYKDEMIKALEQRVADAERELEKINNTLMWRAYKKVTRRR